MELRGTLRLLAQGLRPSALPSFINLEDGDHIAPMNYPAIRQVSKLAQR